MAILDIDNTTALGHNCKVYDANGVLLPDTCWCDTETGEVRHYVRDVAGVIKLTADKTEVIREVNFASAPLQVQWLRSPNPRLVGLVQEYKAPDKD